MKLDSLSTAEVLELNLDTGVPLVYDLDPEGKVLSKVIL
jgi:bisphosphoglycerate-dependent phosphoglycerate mutase